MFLSLHESVRLEYAGGKEIRIDTADLEFEGSMLLDAGGCPIRIFQAESPHTDDSTLVHVPGEKVLFLGDAAGGNFPTWEKDPVLVRKLARTVENTRAAICLEGHWTDVTMKEMMDDFASDMG